MLEPYAQHHVLNRTNSYEIFTFEPQALPVGRNGTIAYRYVVKISPIQPFSIFFSSSSDIQVCLPKHMVVEHTAELSDVAHEIYQKAFHKEPPRWMPIFLILTTTFTRISLNMLSQSSTSLQLIENRKLRVIQSNMTLIPENQRTNG